MNPRFHCHPALIVTLTLVFLALVLTRGMAL